MLPSHVPSKRRMSSPDVLNVASPESSPKRKQKRVFSPDRASVAMSVPPKTSSGQPSAPTVQAEDERLVSSHDVRVFQQRVPIALDHGRSTQEQRRPSQTTTSTSASGTQASKDIHDQHELPNISRPRAADPAPTVAVVEERPFDPPTAPRAIRNAMQQQQRVPRRPRPTNRPPIHWSSSSQEETLTSQSSPRQTQSQQKHHTIVKPAKDLERPHALGEVQSPRALLEEPLLVPSPPPLSSTPGRPSPSGTVSSRQASRPSDFAGDRRRRAVHDGKKITKQECPRSIVKEDKIGDVQTFAQAFLSIRPGRRNAFARQDQQDAAEPRAAAALREGRQINVLSWRAAYRGSRDGR